MAQWLNSLNYRELQIRDCKGVVTCQWLRDRNRQWPASRFTILSPHFPSRFRFIAFDITYDGLPSSIIYRRPLEFDRRTYVQLWVVGQLYNSVSRASGGHASLLMSPPL
jgi:hypothetical protein